MRSKSVRRTVLGLAAAAALFSTSSGAAIAAEPASGEMFGNTTFDNDSAPWQGNDTDIRVVNGELEVAVDSGGFGELPGGIVNPWERSVLHDDLALTGYQLYMLEFDARATRDVTVDASVNTFTGQYVPYWERPIALTATMKHFQVPVAIHQSAADLRFGFQVGTYGPAYRMYLDNISLTPVQ